MVLLSLLYLFVSASVILDDYIWISQLMKELFMVSISINYLGFNSDSAKSFLVIKHTTLSIMR